MNLNELTEKDYELLMEMVDAWEQEPANKGLSESMLTACLLGGDRNERMRKAKDVVLRGNDETKGRRAMAIILRAKLEIARQSAQARGIATAAAEEPKVV